MELMRPANTLASKKLGRYTYIQCVSVFVWTREKKRLGYAIDSRSLVAVY
jgi:hypothetical protein